MSLFVLAICAPVLRQVLIGDNTQERERSEFRKLGEFPEWGVEGASIWTFSRDFDAWYGDHFGFRARLLRWHNGLKWLGFGVSPSESMVQGRDGWMFTTDSRSIEMYRGTMPFTGSELEEWRWSLEGRRDELARHGIEYVFAIGPSKWEIYPEKMPGRITRVGPSRLDQLTAYMEKHSDVHMVDLRPVLLEAKQGDEEGDLTYYPLGTHWTERGAMAAYQRLRAKLSALLPGYRGSPVSDFELVRSNHPGDSWARRMYLEDVLIQRSKKFKRIDPAQAREIPAPKTPPRTLRTEHPDGDLPRAVFIHDSFAEQMRHWLAEDFAEFTAYWRYEYDEGRILASKPDVVLQLWVGRALEFMPPSFMLQESPNILRTLFNGSERTVLKVGASQVPRTAGAGLWRLPPCDREPGGRVVAHVRVRSRRQASLVFLREDPEFPGHGRARLGIVRLNPGSNELYVLLHGVTADSRILLGPPVPAGEGEITIESLELRALRTR